jgi:hypothetical protein
MVLPLLLSQQLLMEKLKTSFEGTDAEVQVKIDD